ncbi:MAG: D-alanyl-D-alanine carboxypeptidase [Clostridiales bacterium]|nr:D-alanyl-D-alanine carboxypeptidase [Clostridiales bacterium]
MKKIVLSFVLILMCSVSFFYGEKFSVFASEEVLDIGAKSYVVVNENGSVLVEKDKDKKVEVASICKLMTTLIVLEKIEDKSLSLDDEFVVSEYASSIEGSQAFLDAGSKYFVRDLLKSVIVASANDSAVVLAENVAGSEKSFVSLMNDKCKVIGMKNTLYANSTGLPAINQYSTAYDTSLLLNVVSSYDLYVEYSQIWMDELVHPSGRKTELVNTNRLIKYYDYCLTGKTGFTDEAGYCLSSTSLKDNLKLTAVVLGCNSSADRFTDSMKLYNYAFANYENEQIIKAGNLIENSIKISSSKVDKINVIFEKDFYLLKNKNKSNNYSIEYNLPTTLKAPILEGQEVGYAMIIVDGIVVGEVNIVSAENYDKQTFGDILNKITTNFNRL